MMNRSAPRLPLVLATVAALGCAPPPPKGPAHTVASHPRALDRYARLLRRELADSDPIAVHQEMACEQSRLFDALGGEEMVIRANSVEDSIFPTQVARIQRDMIRNRLAGRSFETGGALCDSLRRIADREDPIAPVDSVAPRR